MEKLLDAAAGGVLCEGDNPVAVAISFPGGDYIVPTGGTSEDAVALRHLLMAYFLHEEPPPAELRMQALRVAFAVLRLADHVSAAARFDRRGHAAVQAGKQDLARALRISTSELASIAGDFREALEPLVTEELDRATWSVTPILRDGDTYIVAGAGELLVVLRHQLVLLAEQHGWRETLAERLAAAYGATVRRALQRFGWSETPLSAGDELPATHNVWSFDRDAAAVVTVLSDDLADYDAGQPEAPWRAERYLDALEERSRELLTELFVGTPAPDRLLHLVVLAGVARPSLWFDRPPDRVLQAPQLSFYAGDLELISVAERGDPLALWRFAVDADRFAARFFAEDPLELFALWRSNDHSFYLGDDRPPTFVTSAGRDEALRREVTDLRDRHGAPGPTGRGLVEVVRRFDDLDVPLYRPLTADIPGVLVEASGLRAWVLAEPGDRTLGQLVDAVAFWIWQLAGAIGCESLEIVVSLGDEPRVEVREAEPGRLTVTLDPERMPEFQRPDNAGERELVRALLQTLHGSWSGSEVADVVDRFAPIGHKKMILVFGPNADDALDSRDLPPARPPLRDSDDAQAMDELGEHLRDNLGLPKGPIAAEQRVCVLWAAITFHLDQVGRLVASLKPDGVLETLVAANERLLNQGAFNRYTVPTREACFRESTDIPSNLRREAARHAAASTALRFVIEYVAAQPPQGIRPFTLSVQDRLVALAFQVCARGGVSDALREGLDDTPLSMLASGRLGVAREGRFYSRRDRFADRFVAAEVRRARRFFPSLWRDDEPGQGAEDDVAMLDSAAVHEWGASLSEILELFGALVHISGRSSATTMRLAQGVDKLADLLGWEREKVSGLIGQFALAPREQLLVPDPPFERSDVYPWRYGRRLSAVRRPLVIRPGRDGHELVYGFRAVDTAGRQLVHDLQTARLKVSSAEMRRAITTLRQRDDLRFNREIAELYHEIPGLIIRERVKQIGHLPIARSNGDLLGDIDVLVADPGHRVLHAIDTKNLAPGRTPIEIARELRRTFKTEGSKPAAMDTHAERAAWLTRHRAEVLEWLGLDAAASETWRVEPSIVVNTEVTAPFLEDLPMRVLDAALLADELAARLET